MDIYVMDKSLKTLDVIDYCKSIIWVKRYFGAGDFEIVVPACEHSISLLKEDRFLYRPDDYAIMIVKKIQLQTDVEAGDQLIVSGPSIESSLSRRIIWEQTNLNGNVANGIKRLLLENAVSPANDSRKIPYLTIGSLCEEAAKVPLVKQITGDPLDEAISSICKTYGVGYRIVFDYIHNKFVFELFSGTDRSYAQHDNAYVVFSEEFGNLLSSDYVKDFTNYKNVAIVAGEGEGKARKKAIVGDAKYWDRYEVFVDRRDLSTNDGEITDEEYQTLLSEAGSEQLADNLVTESFESEVAPTINYTYGVDYFLGDIVQIENAYGIKVRARITEIIESEDESGHTYIPTFENVEV